MNEAQFLPELNDGMSVIESQYTHVSGRVNKELRRIMDMRVAFLNYEIGIKKCVAELEMRLYGGFYL